MLKQSETEAFAASIRDLLADPANDLTVTQRARWQGALAALEAVLEHPPTLVADGDGATIDDTLT